MDRVAVFVDAGYLFAQASKAMFGEYLPRGHMKLDAAAVTAALKDFAESHSQLDLLRIYWYDGTSMGPTQQHIALAELPGVKVRLGFVNTAGQQKGVDSLIVTDMVALAQHRAMASCVLLSGDEDLRVGVQLAQNHGVRVHLLGITPARQSQSRFLRQEADAVHSWTVTDLGAFLSRTPAPPVDKPPKAIDSLEGVAQEVAATIPEEEITGLIDSISETKMRPKEIDGRLLARGLEVIGKPLDPIQKRAVRASFLEALRARLSRSQS